jgi:hypothetical protein
MNYKEQYEKAQKAKAGKKLNPDFITFDNPKDMVVGRFLNAHPVPGKKEGETYNQYLMETDDGLIKFHMGSVADGEIGVQLAIGGVYAIIYKGKEDLGGGRSVNKFDCYEVPEMPEDAEDGKPKRSTKS